MKKQINPTIKASTKSTEGQTPNILKAKLSPNILLIIADDLGQDVVNIDVSGTSPAMEVHTNDGTVDIYGALPNISRLLRNGLYFSQAWAQPACSTTRASIYTGLHPWKNGVGHPDEAELDSSKEKGFKTLPTLLPSNYVSGLFGKWHLGKVDPYLPTNHGWDRHVGTLDGVFRGKYIKKGSKKPIDIDYTHWLIQDSDDKDPDYGATDYLGTETNSYATWREVYEAVRWINAQGSATPWFATIAFHSPHVPYHVPSSGYDEATAGKEAASDAYMFNIMAQNMDWHIGVLLGVLSGGSSLFKGIDEARLSNTIIFFIGDNGSDVAVALAEEKGEIYEGSVRVPMCIADGQAVVKEIKGETITPRFLHASRLNATCGLLAHVVDLYKTIVHLVNPAENGFSENTQSVSFRDVVADPMFAFNARTGQKRTYNFSQLYKTGSTKATIRNAAWKGNAAYKLNYDASKTPNYALYKYSGSEIPGREDDDDGDLFTDAISGKNAEAQTNLNLLYNELFRNYRRDGDENTFPALTKK